MDNRVIAYPKFVVQETAFAKRKHGPRICNNGEHQAKTQKTKNAAISIYMKSLVGLKNA